MGTIRLWRSSAGPAMTCKVHRGAAPALLGPSRAVQDGVWAAARAATEMSIEATIRLATLVRDAVGAPAVDGEAWRPRQARCLAARADEHGVLDRVVGDAARHGVRRHRTAQPEPCGGAAARQPLAAAEGWRAGGERRSRRGLCALRRFFSSDDPELIGPHLAAHLAACVPAILRAACEKESRVLLDGATPELAACEGWAPGLDALQHAAARVADVAVARTRRASLAASHAAAAGHAQQPRAGPHERNAPDTMSFDLLGAAEGKAVDAGESSCALRVVRGVVELGPAATHTVALAEPLAMRERFAGLACTVTTVYGSLAAHSLSAAAATEHRAAAEDLRNVRALAACEPLALAWRAARQLQRRDASCTALLCATPAAADERQVGEGDAPVEKKSYGARGNRGGRRVQAAKHAAKARLLEKDRAMGGSSALQPPRPHVCSAAAPPPPLASAADDCQLSSLTDLGAPSAGQQPAAVLGVSGCCGCGASAAPSLWASAVCGCARPQLSARSQPCAVCRKSRMSRRSSAPVRRPRLTLTPNALADSACAVPLALLLAVRRPPLCAQGLLCGSALWGGGALTAATPIDQSAALSAGHLEQLGGGSALDEEEDERRMDGVLLLALGEVEAQELDC